MPAWFIGCLAYMQENQDSSCHNKEAKSAAPHSYQRMLQHFDVRRFFLPFSLTGRVAQLVEQLVA